MKTNGIQNSRMAATPAGVVSFASGYRGYRSCLAQPPANRWHPFGMTDRISEPGGFSAISRWLRSNATTPPDANRDDFRIPEGCQRVWHDDARGVSRYGLRSLRDRVRCVRDRGCRYAQPPANRWHPSGMTAPVATLRSPRLSEIAVPEPGGFKAISRWLSEARATPPDRRPHSSRIPEGCQPHLRFGIMFSKRP